MPVYSIPAADVEARAAEAVAAAKAVRQAQDLLDRYLAAPDGQALAAALQAGSITEDDALATMYGMLAGEVKTAADRVRNRVRLTWTVITPAEVTRALRKIWPHCRLGSRDAGDNLIEVTMPERPGTELLRGASADGTGDYQAAERMLFSLLGTSVKVAGVRRTRPRDGGTSIKVTLSFPRPGS